MAATKILELEKKITDIARLLGFNYQRNYWMHGGKEEPERRRGELLALSENAYQSIREIQKIIGGIGEEIRINRIDKNCDMQEYYNLCNEVFENSLLKISREYPIKNNDDIFYYSSNNPGIVLPKEYDKSLSERGNGSEISKFKFLSLAFWQAIPNNHAGGVPCDPLKYIRYVYGYLREVRDELFSGNDETKTQGTITEKRVNESGMQKTFQLNRGGASGINQITKLYQKMKQYGFIEASVYDFKAAFGIGEIRGNIIWKSGNASELLYFYYCLVRCEVIKNPTHQYKILTYFFKKADNEPFNEQLKNLYPKIMKDAIYPKRHKDIDTCFTASGFTFPK